MDSAAGLRLVGLIIQGLALGEKLVPLFERVTGLAKDYQDPDRVDVTLATLDEELAQMQARSKKIQDS